MRELRDTERLSDLLKVTQLIEGSHVNIHRMISALIVKALGSVFYFLDLQRPHSWSRVLLRSRKFSSPWVLSFLHFLPPLFFLSFHLIFSLKFSILTSKLTPFCASSILALVPPPFSVWDGSGPDGPFLLPTFVVTKINSFFSLDILRIYTSLSISDATTLARQKLFLAWTKAIAF